jgi:hypothetical protein
MFNKRQLRSVLSILHEHTNYNYQRRCYEYCNQTYFLFLNDIEKNTIFTHNPANAKGVSNYDIVDKKLPVFFYTSSKGTYKFTAYDLRNFSHKGVPFKDSFQVGKLYM